jgi:hypothetical protein
MSRENCLFLAILRTEITAFKDHESGVPASLTISHLFDPAVPESLTMAVCLLELVGWKFTADF